METITDDVAVETTLPVEDFDPAIEGGAPEVGDIEVPVEQPPVLDLDQFADQVIDLGNGEFLPVAELKNGAALRQADYTRKTQELAELRKQAESALTLDQALRADPQGTLQYLASKHGMTIAEAQAAVAAQQQQSANDNWWEDDYSDSYQQQPQSDLEARLARMEQIEQQRQAQAELDNVFGGLKAKYGEDFNEQEVARAAAERGIYDPRMLEMVYRDLAFEKITMARTQATTQAQQQAAAEEARRRQAAAEAAASTGAGASAVGVVETPPPPRRNITGREAAEMAWEQLTRDL